MYERINELLESYEGLRLVDGGDYGCTKITGHIQVHRSIEQFVLNKQYEISIFVPKKEKELPYVVDVGGAIDKDYPHIYDDQTLCLATDIDMVKAFDENPSLRAWMNDFVEPYFVTYEYYVRYGEFPMGDREHGEKGILKSYAEIFSVGDMEAFRIMRFVARGAYRGHHPCPCGSGEKLRKCHGNVIRKFIDSDLLLSQTQKDSGILR